MDILADCLDRKPAIDQLGSVLRGMAHLTLKGGGSQWYLYSQSRPQLRTTSGSLVFGDLLKYLPLRHEFPALHE